MVGCYYLSCDLSWHAQCCFALYKKELCLYSWVIHMLDRRAQIRLFSPLVQQAAPEHPFRCLDEIQKAPWPLGTWGVDSPDSLHIPYGWCEYSLKTSCKWRHSLHPQGAVASHGRQTHSVTTQGLLCGSLTNTYQLFKAAIVFLKGIPTLSVDWNVESGKL